MIVVVAWTVKDQRLIKRGRADLGEPNTYEEYDKPLAAVWCSGASTEDLERAQAKAETEGWTVFCYSDESSTGGVLQPAVTYRIGIGPYSVSLGDVNGDGNASDPLLMARRSVLLVSSYTWRPVSGPELTIKLVPVEGGGLYEVRLLGKTIGFVLQVLTTVRRGKRFIVVEPWHWRYPNSNKNHGSHLTSAKDACSGLLFALLSEGKLPKGSSHA